MRRVPCQEKRGSMLQRAECEKMSKGMMVARENRLKKIRQYRDLSPIVLLTKSVKDVEMRAL
jgi:hypothetical protein